MPNKEDKYCIGKILKIRKNKGPNGSDREGGAKAYCQLVKDSEPRSFGSFASWQKNKFLCGR